MAERPARPTPAALSGVPVLHPPLLAVYRILLLYATNMGKTPFSAIVRPTLLLAVGAVALWLVLWALIRNRYKAGLVASILIIASLTGWHVLEYGMRDVLPLISGFPAEGFYVLYAAAIAAGFILIARRHRGHPRTTAFLLLGGVLASVGVVLLVVFFLAPAFGTARAWAMVSYVAVTVAAISVVIERPAEYKTLTQTANWFALILVGISLALIFVHRPASTVPANGASDLRELEGLAIAQPPAQKPDIYLIVLDGYSRDDVLRQEYGFNNIHFLNVMRDKGFWVADKSFANYSSSLPSLASCLNMEYVQHLLPDSTPKADAVDLVNLYHYNRLYAFLRAQGYRLTVFSPGMELTEPRENVDRVMKPTGALSEFEAVLLDTSAAERVIQLYDYWVHGSIHHSAYKAQRRRVLYTFDGLGNMAEEKSDVPRLIVAHILIPQPPFLFNREGGWPDTSDLVAPTESGSLHIRFASFRNHYNDQLQYTNSRLADTVDRILKNSATPPVILIASSRGAGVSFRPTDTDEAKLRERFGNLLMVHLPGQPSDQPLLSPGQASLVNLFRVALNRTLGTAMPLEEPAAFVCSDGWPMEFSPAPHDALLR